jgi:hypothetical protein
MRKPTTPSLSAVALAALAVATPVTPVHARVPQTPVLDEYTANTVGANTLKLGILAFEYGITDRLSIGTDPPMWAVRTVARVLVPNVHIKFEFLDHPQLRTSAQAGIYYMDITRVDEAGGTLLTVPLTLWGSIPIVGPLVAHLEGAYIFVDGSGTGDLDRIDLEGTVSTQALQFGAMLEYRVKPWLAFTVRGRYQPWMRPVRFEGESQISPFTRAAVEAEITPVEEHPYSAVAGVAFLWKHVHLRLGAGYGSYFLPGMNVPVAYQGVIPDGTLSVLF